MYEISVPKVIHLSSRSGKAESLQSQNQAWPNALSGDIGTCAHPDYRSTAQPTFDCSVSFSQAIFGQISEPLLVLDGTRQLIATNAALEKRLAYPAEAWPGLSLRDLLVAADEGSANAVSATNLSVDALMHWHLQQINQQGQHQTEQFMLCTATGELIPVESRGSRIRYQGKTIFCLLFRELDAKESSHARSPQAEQTPQASVSTPTCVPLCAAHALDQVQLVGAIAQRVRHTLDLEPLVATAAQELGQLLKAEWLAIVRYKPDQNQWHSVAEYGAKEFVPSQAVGLANPAVPDAVATQLKCLNVVQITGRDRANIESEAGSWLWVPLHIDATLWGSLCLGQHQSSGWQPAAIELVQAAAEQLMIAIEHSQLYQQVQHLNRELEQTVHCRTAQLRQALSCEAMLKRITDKVRDSLDESHILETAVAELAMLFGVDCCDAALYDVHRKISTIAYEVVRATGAGVFPPAQGQTISMVDHYPEIYDELLTCQPVQFCCTEHSIHAELRQRVVLACPIFDNQGVLGDLWLFRPGAEGFDDLEIRLVQQVATQCAIALRQARLYQAAQTQVHTLEHISQLKDNFLSTVSHELRTPIATIKMAIQMLTLAIGREGLLPEPSKPSLSANKIAHYLKILNDECNREIGLITDLLDLQRLEAGTHTVNTQPIHLSAYLQRLVCPFQEQAMQLNQRFCLDLALDLPILLSDAQSLERILVELLNNACKYTPEGEYISLTAIQSELPDHSPSILLSIVNTGIEIPPEHLGHIFDMFYRVPGNDPYEHSGTGLGLALVKKLVLQLNGKVWVESSQGATCFRVELPVKPSELASAA